MIKIELNNEYKFTNENKYEYSKTLLSGLESKYIGIPLSIIVNNNMDAKRVSITSYLKAHCGLNDIVGFTVPDMVEWCGAKPDRRTNGTNDKFLSVIDDLANMGYITYLNEKSKSSYMKCKFNTDYFNEQCSYGYSVLYLDEIEKIMHYKKSNAKDNSITNTNILLVFAYFRNKIKRRPNELNIEDRSYEGIIKRKERYPEVYYDTISNISNEIGISSKTISKIIYILEYELKLIVSDRAYRIKNETGKFKTLPIMFANAYKREDKYLLLTEENYGRKEIELKTKKIKDYKIDKRKRKEVSN